MVLGYIAAYWSMVYREPSVFEARVHGPGAHGSGAQYPWPSTIAGMLASLAFEAGSCNPDVLRSEAYQSLFGDTEYCLRQVFGQSYHLYTGFVYWNGNRRVYAYTGRAFLELRALLASLKTIGYAVNKSRDANIKEIIGFLEKDSRLAKHYRLSLPRKSRTGIGLRRKSKAVREGLIYTVEDVYQFRRSGAVELLVLIEGVSNEQELKGSYLVKLGAEYRPALLRLEPGSLLQEMQLACKKREDECGDRIIVFTTSPALLTKSPWQGESGEETGSHSIVLDREQYPRKLAELLLEAANLNTIVEPVEPYYYTVTGTPIETVMPGWSMALQDYRRPMLVVPPGSILFFRARSGCAADALREVVRSGLGISTRLGWGTVVGAVY